MVEVDFLPASQSQSGDCILIRLGSFSYANPGINNQIVIMIDSGFTGCSDCIKKYLNNHYGTNFINYVFITHPDADHISGLNALLDDRTIGIGKVIINDPWNHVNEVFNRSSDGRRTRKSILGKFEDTLKVLDQVFDKIEKRKIETQEGFAGAFLEWGDYKVQILGPSEKFYENLLSQFPGMENEKTHSSASIYEEKESDWRLVDKYFLDNPQTSAKNDSSMIILLSHRVTKMNGLAEVMEPLFLFTGDAGIDALWRALLFAENEKIRFTDSYFQLPHHGSIKNMSASILECLDMKKCIVSATSNDDEHPSRLLVNYINIVLNKKIFHVADRNGIRFSFDESPDRPGWSSAQKKAAFTKVFKLQDGI